VLQVLTNVIARTEPLEELKSMLSKYTEKFKNTLDINLSISKSMLEMKMPIPSTIVEAFGMKKLLALSKTNPNIDVF
jgi:hypothetical protein